MKKNFKNFKEFVKNVSVNFSTICLSQTWYESQEESRNSNYILSSYSCLHQYRQYSRGYTAILRGYIKTAELDKICQ